MANGQSDFLQLGLILNLKRPTLIDGVQSTDFSRAFPQRDSTTKVVTLYTREI